MNRILAVYGGEGADHLGRTRSEIVAWSDQRLEYTHDYIQWLFPLTEGSPVNPYAPVLDAETIAEFRARPELRSRLLESFDCMLAFYGLRRSGAGVAVISLADNFAARARNWLTAHNHNHLRITRILKCLRLLGLEVESLAFFDCLSGIYATETASSHSRITEESFRFWQAAAGIPAARG